jgi:hypothetical protein
VPGGGFAGICGVESGSAAPLVGGPPGIELQTVLDGLPSRATGDTVPVVLPTPGVEMVPNAAAGIVAVDGVVEAAGVDTGAAVMAGGGSAGIAVSGGAGTVEPGIVDRNDVAGWADNVSSGAVVLSVVDVAEGAGAAATDGIIPLVLPAAGIGVTGTAAVAGVICPVGVEQVTTVPGVVGSEASGSGASVVSGTLGWVAAENGLGPLSGEDSMVPGVDARPMAVVPMVETCARLALPPSSRAAAVNSKRRMAIAPSAPI